MKSKIGPKVYTEAFKLHVLEEMASGKWKSALEASRAYRVTGSNTVYSWRDDFRVVLNRYRGRYRNRDRKNPEYT